MSSPKTRLKQPKATPQLVQRPAHVTLVLMTAVPFFIPSKATNSRPRPLSKLYMRIRALIDSRASASDYTAAYQQL